MTTKRNWTKNETLAYCAGFFDGEGSIGAYTAGGAPRLQVMLPQRIEEPLKVFRDIWGGRIKPPIGKHVCFHWTLYSSPKIRYMLTDILPWLVIKYDQAILGIEFANLMLPSTGGSTKIPTENFRRRLEIVDEFRALKTPWK
jgi:hypothetical protein